MTFFGILRKTEQDRHASEQKYCAWRLNLIWPDLDLTLPEVKSDVKINVSIWFYVQNYPSNMCHNDMHATFLYDSIDGVIRLSKT